MPKRNMVSLQRGTRIKFKYTNYKGETATRRAMVLEFFYGANEYHPEPGMLMLAYDFDKSAPRAFAVKDIIELGLYE